MRGAMLWQAGEPGARALLTRFLEVSPEDAAAESVHSMLEEGLDFSE